MPPGETLFITYRLHGTIPYSILLELRAEHEKFLAKQIIRNPEEPDTIIRQRWEARYFLSIDTFLDISAKGDSWLGDAQIASIVKESIHYRDEKQFHLHAYCVMPNHVHLLITNTEVHAAFHQVLGSMKANSSKKANAYLNRIGQPFWQEESYDHIVRNSKSFDRIVSYILNNPVKAGLATCREEWPHSYCKHD